MTVFKIKTPTSSLLPRALAGLNSLFLADKSKKMKIKNPNRGIVYVPREVFCQTKINAKEKTSSRDCLTSFIY